MCESDTYFLSGVVDIPLETKTPQVRIIMHSNLQIIVAKLLVNLLNPGVSPKNVLFTEVG